MITETAGRLKKLWYYLFIPLALCGVVLFAIHPASEEGVSPIGYFAKSMFFILVLALVPATSIYLARSLEKNRDQEEEKRVSIFEKAYRIRIYTFALLSWLSAGMIYLSADRAFWLIYGVLMILFLNAC